MKMIARESYEAPESHDREFFTSVTVTPAQRLSGSPAVPGDKSISHRMLMLGALAHGETRITNLLDSADVRSTRGVIEALGVPVSDVDGTVVVQGRGPAALHEPAAVLDCGNSGTTMRLMAGVLAAQPFVSQLDGDDSLRSRPMRRVAEPLWALGATIELGPDERAPIVVRGGNLSGAHYDLPLPSAQVKSALLLGALGAVGETVIGGELGGRDHTERLLRHFGVELEVGEQLRLRGGQTLQAADLRVPGDQSSAAFWLAAATIVPGSSVRVEDVGVNPTRMGFVRVLQRMGAKISVTSPQGDCEPVATLVAEYADLRATTIDADEVPALIDELPLIAILATYAVGLTEVRGARELRVKESDRIEAIAVNLRAMGAQVEVLEDGFRIAGPQPLNGAKIRTFGDHRIAMACAIAALGASSPTTIDDAACVAISYPTFFATLRELTGSPVHAGVLGSSLAHSRSPDIFAWLARATGTNVAYERFERSEGDVVALFETIRRDPALMGCNVTVPYKELAYRLVDRRSPVAETVGAVNVVARRGDGTLDGHNTDVIGILATLDAHEMNLRGKQVCLLGAGGAAAAAFYALAQRGPAQIVVANRTPERAVALISRFARHLPGLSLRADPKPREKFALVVDATPGVVGGEIAFAPGSWAFDLKYGAMPSPFLTHVKAAGLAQTVDGLEMLVAQALATFEIWFRDGRPFPSDEKARYMDGLLAHLRHAR
ncbi:MAG: 3-phosphoshikimate 1-carboxyvinyltransferase [Candidatus Velthaea sp.]